MLKCGWNKIKRIVKTTVVVAGSGIIIYHAASQLNYLANQITQTILPSKMRTEFYEQTGIKITGFRVEDEDRTLMSFLQTVKDEGITSKEIGKIVLESHNYFEKPFLGQLSQTIFTSYSGYNNPITNNIVMNNGGLATLIHEMKHAKTFNNPHKNELLKEWEKIAADENRRTQYKGALERFASRIRLLSRLVPYNEDYESLGFVSDYARTDVYEDIAETATSAELYVFDLIHKMEKTPKIQQKVELAVKFGLLPREYMDYLNYHRVYSKLTIGSTAEYLPDHWKGTSWSNYVDSLRIEVIAQSNAFLRNNPESKYECEIRNNLGTIKGHISRYGCVQNLEAEPDYKAALLSERKTSEYFYSLLKLEELHKQHYNQYGSDNPYTLALREYRTRKDACDTSIFTVGVNDFLVQLGEL